MRVTTFQHPQLGCVRIVPHPTSGKFTARWKQGFLKVIVPARATRSEIDKALASMSPRLLEKKPVAIDIKDIVLPDWSVTVTRQSLNPDKVLLSFRLPQCEILIGDRIDISGETGQLLFNRALRTIAKHIAPDLLMPRARQISEDLGVAPRIWKISHGNQVLGHCNSRKEIALSYLNVFLTPHLRDYIICHELAHLTHMNHSDDFHRLCDAYLGGREKELINELNRYIWPIKR